MILVKIKTKGLSNKNHSSPPLFSPKSIQNSLAIEESLYPLPSVAGVISIIMHAPSKRITGDYRKQEHSVRANAWRNYMHELGGCWNMERHPLQFRQFYLPASPFAVN
ncbi:hypothetical protein CDAR_176631 [Caerostris darwini]|uniref:Uncharacterized protein n=1 Tax=Caerostris darwini TaxID=1538125 RepID=A0AAV4VK03_9ARAC|nr:hypothetical protein CDAR_176631 [Caerostris darwini]